MIFYNCILDCQQQNVWKDFYHFYTWKTFIFFKLLCSLIFKNMYNKKKEIQDIYIIQILLIHRSP